MALLSISASRPDVVRVEIDVRLVFLAGNALPPIYLLSMMAYGAIRYPYWDHIETARLLVSYFDHKLTSDQLLAPQAQAIPLIPRLVFIALATVTRWNISFEYVVLAATIAVSFLTLLYSVRRLALKYRWARSAEFFAMILVSVVACSPAGSMNYNWSLMLIATIAYACILVAIVSLCIKPASITTNASAIALAWVASYSMTQGLFVFPIAILIQQLAARRLFLPTAWTLFWFANMVLAFFAIAAKVPHGGVAPTLSHYLLFVLVYVGQPLGELIWFPTNGAVDLPETFYINSAVGFALIACITYTFWLAFQKPRGLRELLFSAFASFGLMSAIVTAWGRATGPLAVENANASRYSIFSACILYALIFYYGGSLSPRSWQRFALFGFGALVCVSYIRGITPYGITRAQNTVAIHAYTPDASPTKYDRQMYPDENVFRQVRLDLLRLKIGPYRALRATVRD